MDKHSATARSRSKRGPAWQRILGVALILLVVVAVAIGAAIALSSETASRDDVISQAIRLSVTLIIPAGVMIVYWFIAQRQVRNAKSDLRARLDSGQDLIARVSHQLRDRLTVIYGFSEALLDIDTGDPTEVRDVVTIINSEAVDLSRIVDDLVSAAELDAGEFDVSFGKFDPSVEIERVVLPFRRRGQEITVGCWSGTAFSDPIRFRQIVRTLLSNAIEHGDTTVGLVGELSNGSFHCTVVDDGDGMSSDLEGQFFGSPADEVKSMVEVEGTGLGLSVSHAIAHQLGGRLTYQRSTDLTMVTMILPTADWPDVPSATDTSNDVEGSEDEDEVAEHTDTATGIDGEATEHELDIDQDEDHAHQDVEADVDASEGDWSISFDEEDAQDRTEDAEAVAEVPASS